MSLLGFTWHKTQGQIDLLKRENEELRKHNEELQSLLATQVTPKPTVTPQQRIKAMRSVAGLSNFEANIYHVPAMAAYPQYHEFVQQNISDLTQKVNSMLQVQFNQWTDDELVSYAAALNEYETKYQKIAATLKESFSTIVTYWAAKFRPTQVPPAHTSQEPNVLPFPKKLN